MSQRAAKKLRKLYSCRNSWNSRLVMSEPRFMRIMVFFDLPVTTKKKRRDYTRFRKFLTTDGYDMLQFSVYSRIVNGEDSVDKHLKRLRSNLPPEGSVRFLQITERQYAAMKLLLGNQTPREKLITTQMTLEF